MPTAVLILPLGCLSVACVGEARDETGRPPTIEGDTDTDTDADTDADTDTDTDTDPGVDITSCPSAIGFSRVGTAWTYSGTAGLFCEHSVERFDEGPGEGIETHDCTLDGGIEFQSRTDFLCDEWGYSHLAVYWEYTDSGGSSWYRQSYDQPYRQVPHEMEVGDAWTMVWQGSVENDSGATSTFHEEVERVVESEENLTVEAGTWLALKVVEFWGEADLNFWYCDEVGLLATETFSLVSYEP